MIDIDKINCEILNLLQENCRMSLTEIAKRVNLSVDSVKKRVDKLMISNLFVPKIQMRPRHFGHDNVVEVKVKLHNYSEDKIKEFQDFCLNNPKIVELLKISGEWDYTLVFIAKNSIEIGTISKDIRNNFSEIIDKWSESLTTWVLRFENYDMIKIMGFENE